MDIQHLRQSLKMKWLNYYEENRSWLVKMRIWKDYHGLRRPSSGYILATLSVLEPELKKILPFILDLNNNPDQIIAALGLHFNPEQELNLSKSPHSQAKNEIVSTSPAHIPLTDSSISKERKQVLLNMTTGVSVLAVATPVYHHSTAKLPVAVERINTEISSRSKPVPLSSTKLVSNGRLGQIPGKHFVDKTSLLHQTNARSLPSWIDEFCPGRGNKQS
ncbi:DUF5331 domain-containing protein [Anabaena sp. UHCC 0204]|uniref:DUF5331 domain-containing protein n=1 Tax=Anabaena sp. UHCC 0204 TaxID=2590009 RepID=UPI0014471F5B|nr:DUF5331 domain-containing protein [Anabaena sp. UHCC 0204]MTJ10316.1 hypothetical protein [Anabaena sp. UHCC 0204]